MYYSGEKGFEPLTFGFGDHYSTIETILLFQKEKHSVILLFSVIYLTVENF